MLVDLSNVEASKEMGAVPPGQYPVVVDQASVEAGKTFGAKYIKVAYKITEGDYQDRMIFQMFNIQNPSDKAELIGKQQLKAMMLASGMNGDQLETVSDLIGKRLVVKTGVRKSDQYGEQTVVKSFAMTEELDGGLGL